MKRTALLHFSLLLFAFLVSAGARPLPSPALAERLKDPVEVFGIVHWGPNTFTARQWGEGDESPSLVDAPHFDADQIVRACKAGGLQGLVIVAKHHDGMCLWPTKTTDHRIGWDYVGKMVAACRAHGLKHGFYVSPWDRNHADYGRPAYVDVFWKQVLEVTGGAYGDPWELWLDSANGGMGWYGGARESRPIPDGYYRIDELVKKVRERQPRVCVFFDRTPGDFHFPANEKGELDPDARATFREKGEPETPGWPDGPKMGDPNGRHFSQHECDLPLRAEWFYDKAHDGYTKSPAYLMKIYLRTVGNGGTMDLGIAPTAEGRISDEDAAALAGFAELKRRYFGKRIGEGRFAASSNPSLARVASPSSRAEFIQPCSNSYSGSSFKLSKPFNTIVMRENLSKGEQIDGWRLFRRCADGTAVTLAKGRSIGIKRIRTFDVQPGEGELVFEVTASAGEPQDVTFELYDTPVQLVREIADATMCEMTDLKLVCEQKNGWNIRMDRRVDADGTEYADVVLTRDAPAVPPPFSIDFAVPKYDMRHLWRPNADNCRIPPQDGPGFVTSSKTFPPVYSLINDDDRNRLTVVYSEGARQVRHQVGIREANARIRCRAWFFEGEAHPMTNHVVRLRLDHRDIRWDAAVRDSVAWFDKANGRIAPKPRKEMFDPLYSTCYSLPPNAAPETIAEEMSKAAQLGLVRVDDNGEDGRVRVEGCPGDMARNRQRIADARVCSGLPVHGNPLEWQSYETSECAAGNLINSLFGVLRVSMKMQHLSGSYPAMVKHWVGFQTRYADVLLRGSFTPHHPEAGYPVLEGESPRCRIVVGYTPGFVVRAGALDRETVLVDGSLTGRMVVDCPRPVTFAAYDTFGMRQGEVAVPRGLSEVAMPASGYLRWQAIPLVPAPSSCSLGEGAVPLGAVAYSEDATLGPEGYRLSVSASNGVTIASGGAAGRFYAERTLEQLAGKGIVESLNCRIIEDQTSKPSSAQVSSPSSRAEFIRPFSNSNSDSNLKPQTFLPCCLIEDRPAYSWRGVHLDVSRHFFDKAAVTNLLSQMAELKFNVFHWHLTDDQGWRIPVPAYPLLNTVGATRSGPDYVYDPEPGVYGPFGYSEDDIREIRDFARARHIRIVPEIDLPGHSRATLQAYPELFCVTNGTAPTRSMGQDTLCPGNDAALAFSCAAIDRVCELFPDSEAIHIGGDECVRKTWLGCSRCRARMAKEGLKDEGDLQGWFMRQCVAHVMARGRRALGWDEMLDGGLAAGALVMSWRGAKGGIAAAAQGHEVVMCPDEYCYFDYPQELGDDDACVYMPWKCPRLPVAKAYAFDPCAGIPVADRRFVLGGQCNNWTEYTPTVAELEWKMYPRAFAMAEALWCGERKPGYEDFRARALRLRDRFVKRGVNCAPFEQGSSKGETK